MREDWVEHIVQAKEDLRSGARTGSQADVERELRLEAAVERVWPELCTALVAALEVFNRLVPGDEELEIEGDNDNPGEGLIAYRTRGVPARIEIRMDRGGVIHADMSWGNAPQGRVSATPEDTADAEGLFRVSSPRSGSHEDPGDIHPLSLAEHLLTDFLRHI